MEIRKIYDGARMAYAENGKFPAGAGPTPPRGSCCLGHDDRCPPDPALWTGDTWRQLRFSMDDPFQYSYTFESGDTEFSARAEGDLDCDGTYSTFEIVGKVGPGGEISGGAGVFKDNELE